MTVAAMFTQTAYVQSRVDDPVSTRDMFGNVTPSYAAPVGFQCRFEPDRKAQEFIVGQDTQRLSGTVFLEAAAAGVVSGLDRVTVDGQTFEVDGHPSAQRSPSGVHHVEARLTAAT